MDEITEKTLIPKELGDMIEIEVEILLNKGLPDKKAVKLGIEAGVKRWREKHVNKSGG